VRIPLGGTVLDADLVAVALRRGPILVAEEHRGLSVRVHGLAYGALIRRQNLKAVQLLSQGGEVAAAASGAAGQNVGPAGLDLMGVVSAFHEHLHGEPGRFEQSGNVPGFEEAEIEVHTMSPQLVHVPDLLTHMEGEEEKSGRPQYSPCLLESAVQVAGIEVNDRVEGDGGAEFAVCGGKFQQVAFSELHLCKSAAASLDHASGQINPDRTRALLGKPGRDVPGATAEVGDRGPSFRLFQEAGEERPVERLPGELVVQPGRVLLGHGVIAAAYGVAMRMITHVGNHATGSWAPPSPGR